MDFTVNLVTFKNGETTYARTFFKEGGGKISQPDAPTAEGKIFAGWYTAETGGSQWSFDTDTVSSAMTLYARWHDLTEVPAKDATCTEPGNTRHWKCKDCDKLFTASTGETETTAEDVTLPATGHVNTTWTSIDSATHKQICDDCSTVLVASANHEFNGRTCTVCGYENTDHGSGTQSPQTGDAGVAIYAIMALTSCTGTALLIKGKKRK